jgi:hypothetical protein
MSQFLIAIMCDSFNTVQEEVLNEEQTARLPGGWQSIGVLDPHRTGKFIGESYQSFFLTFVYVSLRTCLTVSVGLQLI